MYESTGKKLSLTPVTLIVHRFQPQRHVLPVRCPNFSDAENQP